jgi:hypothetical protein
VLSQRDAGSDVPKGTSLSCLVQRGIALPGSGQVFCLRPQASETMPCATARPLAMGAALGFVEAPSCSAACHAGHHGCGPFAGGLVHDHILQKILPQAPHLIGSMGPSRRCQLGPYML